MKKKEKRIPAAITSVVLVLMIGILIGTTTSLAALSESAEA
jgi:hypothetical protein